MIDINFQQHLARMLPVHKRQTNRLKLFYWPFILLQELFDQFKVWRADVYYRINITGQIISLQSLLNRKVAGANGKIIVKSYNDLGVWVQLSTEAGEAYMLIASLSSESTETINVALEGEVPESQDVDFYVYVPATVNIYEVEKWVNNYKIAGKRYLITQA
ncbi:MAG: hypothetical protein RBU23_13020 [Candidatus Auribacterota bacterium]|jgi:hypothetical protein|nr:hypothetical protein [Candidatus Auribacterota bacterium]